ncbi:hypothetical protein [Egicoccus halophilus]|uniref:Uncharacterized protein n=1 Tax=Egicoccus halophilus TaxID=1670830 RepID=A0A8J3AHB9_9ACTN|nr:hypothetical protein [Egicoccus halophilus]GGI09853.1 hypothetical protein GCM10011354_36130 [Egicoccus halophilus]
MPAKKLDLAAAASTKQPTAYRSHDRAGQNAATRKPKRATVDLPGDVHTAFVVRARGEGLSNQAVLAALATAYANGDERAQALVFEALGG